ncbi:MAG: helix-turn-helix transcriptional regulator [Oscillospiraceae bacterium]|jgi:AraC-like DNA-binding protein|nr:helix-turn-helix transcriptional regulator [Oscillospiraceae bacterium]
MTSLAEMLDKAPNYISSIYKEGTGKSIAQSILDTRLDKARELLLTTDNTISRIIEMTGFMNESNFYKNFKKQYGTTPNNLKLKNKVIEVNLFEA